MSKNVGLLVKAAGAVSGETIVESILTDLYNLAKQTAGDRLKAWHVKKSARKLHRHVHKIRLVKTLWRVDKAVDLKQFYCDSHLMLGGKRTVVRTLKDLEGRKRVLISGIAGQGKSILLRYMCSNALMAGECLPVFIELRRVHTEDSLIDHIQQFLEIVGISSLNDDVLKALLASGKEGERGQT